VICDPDANEEQIPTKPVKALPSLLEQDTKPPAYTESNETSLSGDISRIGFERA
jgi:hypothetical protein